MPKRRPIRNGCWPKPVSQAKQAEAQRDLEVKKAEYAALVKKQQAQADKAYDIQANIMQQQVKAEEVTILQVQKEREVKVQEAEIVRRERELNATVLKAAEAERQAHRNARRGRAPAPDGPKPKAGPPPSARRAKPKPEIIFKKGEAEARAMNVKAEAYQEFNQAAIVDKLITGMPEVVRALAAPLANVDRITVISTGDGQAAGMNKITGDIAKMAAQIPALFETLSGMPLQDLLSKVRTIGEKPAGHRRRNRKGQRPERRAEKRRRYGTLGAGSNTDSGEYQRPGGQGGRP